MNVQATQVKRRRMVNMKKRIAVQWNSKCEQYEGILDFTLFRVLIWLFPALVLLFFLGVALRLDGLM